MSLTELSLFSGAGGGILGSILLGHRIIGAVENDEYCCSILEQRQRDGVLDAFPIWQMDIRDFNREVSHIYRGVDIISAGFPCQAYSRAARGRNNAPDLWDETVQSLCLVEPRYVLLENVPAILDDDGAMRRVLGDLASIGYDARWESVPAAAIGANHLRNRVWIVACDSNRHGESGCTLNEETPRMPRLRWADQAEYVGVDDGLAPRMDRLKALGNGQVSPVVSEVWQRLMQCDSQTRSTGADNEGS